MRRNAVIVLALLLVAACQNATTSRTTMTTASAREFETQWHGLIASGRFAAAESLIDARDRQAPGDAEVYVARGNLYYQESRRRSAPGPGGAVDSNAVRAASALTERAVSTLKEGVARQPHRMDIRFGLAFVLQELRRPDEELEVLREAVAYAKAHPDELLWSYGEPLPEPPSSYIPETLHQDVEFYLMRGEPGDDRKAMEIATLSADAYPMSTAALNDIAFVYGVRHEWAKGLEVLKRAEAIDSTSAALLLNMGYTYQNLGKRSVAQRYYERSLTSATAQGDDQIAQQARTALSYFGSGRSGTPPISAVAPGRRGVTPAPPGSVQPVIQPAPPAPVDTAHAPTTE